MSNNPEETPEPTFGQVYVALWVITGGLCLIFGALTVLPFVILLGMVIGPFVMLICAVRFIASIVIDEVKQHDDNER